MPMIEDGVDVTKGPPPKADPVEEAEAVPASEVEVIEDDPYFDLTVEAMVATIHQRDETIRRLNVGQEMMEENRDHWMARAERAESALASFVEDAQAKLQEIRQPNGG